MHVGFAINVILYHINSGAFFCYVGCEFSVGLPFVHNYLLLINAIIFQKNHQLQILNH